MCFFFALYEKPKAKDAIKIAFEGDLVPGGFQAYRDIQVILQEKESTAKVANSKWHFLLEQKEGQWKPSKYTSFNSRWYKGEGFKRSFQKAFQYQRCIIPASAFVEGMNKKYHLLEPANQEPLLFGGLYKQWPVEDGFIISCSMITIDPHFKLESVHKKAMPLILPNEKELLEQWLDPDTTKTEPFVDLMKPQIQLDLFATKIKGATDITPIEKPFLIDKD